MPLECIARAAVEAAAFFDEGAAVDTYDFASRKKSADDFNRLFVFSDLTELRNEHGTVEDNIVQIAGR